MSSQQNLAFLIRRQIPLANIVRQRSRQSRISPLIRIIYCEKDRSLMMTGKNGKEKGEQGALGRIVARNIVASFAHESIAKPYYSS